MSGSGQVQIFDPSKADHDQGKRSLQEIWRLGCLGKPLSGHDQQHFERLARNRFYTFQLSLQHEILGGRREPAKGKIDQLIRGMATELLEGPGLASAWLASEFSTGKYGNRVTLLLRRKRLSATLRRWSRQLRPT